MQSTPAVGDAQGFVYHLCCVRVVAQLVPATGAVRLGVLSSYFRVWVVVQLAPATGAAPVYSQRVVFKALTALQRNNRGHVLLVSVTS